MCDSGWFRHPYFVNRGYRVAPVTLGPGAANPLADESGHGTGESANIFAVAPDIQLLPVKMSFVNAIGAFNAAVGLNPHIITCSWGSDKRFGPLSAADPHVVRVVGRDRRGDVRLVVPQHDPLHPAHLAQHRQHLLQLDGRVRVTEPVGTHRVVALG
mgnify:CR=1 FL=1